MSETSHFQTITSKSESLKLRSSAGFAAAQGSDGLCSVADPRDNRILEALPKNVGNRLFPCLRFVLLRRRDIIHEYGQPLRQIFFPIGSIVSLQCMSTSGSTVQVAMVGAEGLVGVAALLGGATNTVRARVWKSGPACVLPAQRLGKEFDESCELRMLLLRYVQSLFSEMAQTAFCNRHHSIHQQFSRWLLLSLDRLAGSQLRATQEMIADMLGVRVASISAVACKLQDLGVINYHRGRITVLDRQRLEDIACECYATVKSEIEHLQDSLPLTNPARR
jgi:CRP-like cAMP-binding protein